jgi:PAS domain S-box-containing protein
MHDYQTLFRSLPGSYLLLTPDGTIVDNTDAHVAVSLLPREEAVGRDIFVAYPSAPESQQALRESHDYVRTHLQAHTMPLTRYDLQRPVEQGGGFEERYWQITHHPILDSEGRLRYILQQPQDVTEHHYAVLRQKAAERELIEAKGQADFILENVPVMVATTPPNGPSNYFNRHWREFTGRTREELLQNGWATDIHPDDLARLMEWREAQMKSPNEAQIEFRLRRRDGVYRWMIAHSISYFGADGALRLRLSSTLDIHELKMVVEEMLQAVEQQALLADQAQDALRAMENQRNMYYGLFMEAPALIAIVRGNEHRYDFVNPLYQQLFAGRQLLGRTVAEAVPEVVEQGFIDILDHVLATGETYYGREVPIKFQEEGTGALREMYFNFIYQQFRENGRPAGLMCFAFDVTSYVVARRQLEALNQQPDNSAEAQH